MISCIVQTAVLASINSSLKENIYVWGKKKSVLFEKFSNDIYSVSPWEIIQLVNYPEC